MPLLATPSQAQVHTAATQASARVIWFRSLLLIVVHGTVLCAAVLLAPSLALHVVVQKFRVMLATPVSAVLALQLISLPACGFCTCLPCKCQPDAMLQATIPAVQDCCQHKNAKDKQISTRMGKSKGIVCSIALLTTACCWCRERQRWSGCW